MYPSGNVSYFQDDDLSTNGTINLSYRGGEKYQISKYRALNLPYFVELYTDIERKNEGSRYKYFFLDSNLVEQVEVLGVKELAEKVLRSWMPNRYYFHNDNELYLYYPEFTITNDIGESNIIRDLVVQLQFTEDKFIGLKGNRYTFSRKELSCNYRHSHLPARSSSEFSSFCLGGGSEFANYFNKLKVNCSKEEEIEIFLAALEQYLVWESREGKPHISISRLYTNEGASTYHRLNNANIEKLANEFLVHIKPEWLVETGTSFVVDPGLFEKECYGIEKLIVDERYAQYCFDYDEFTNQYVNGETTIRDVSLPSTSVLDETLIRYFGIQPRITEDNLQLDKTNIVKRLGQEDLSKIFDKINSIIQNNQYVTTTN